MSINSIQNVNYLQAPAFKAKGVNESNSAITTNPISAQNVSFNGTEALAAYNYNLVNTNNCTDRSKKDIDLTNLDPTPYFNFNFNTLNNIDGKKEYINGKLNKILAKDGTIYEFGRHNDLFIKKENKTIIINRDKNNNYLCETIIEHNPDGSTKRTMYGTADDGCMIHYEKNGLSKYVEYYSNGKIAEFESYNQKSFIKYQFDENGNIIDCIKK